MGVSVMKKLAAMVALVLTSFALAPGLGAPANAADDYTSNVRTSCHLTVPAVVQIDDSPRIRVHVRPNAPAPAAGKAAAQRAARAEQPTGTVTVSVTRAGTRIFNRTVAYNGSPITVVGPVITRPGHYVVDARFVAADGGVFGNCQDTAAFDVREGGGPDGPDGPGGGTDGPGPGPDGGTDNPGGLLPDTGGPDRGWLLLGLALVAGGLGLVMASRERRRSPYPV